MPSFLPSTTRERVIVAVGLTALTAVAVALRWPGLARGFSPDEVGMVQPWGAWDIFWSHESGSNPPLLRLVFNLLFADAQVVPAGRVGSFVAGILTVPLAFLLGRLVGRSSVAGFLTAAVIVFSPQAVSLSTQFRAYATFDAVLCWHLLVVGAWAEGRRTRGTGIQVAVSAALLVQLHFMGGPILAGVAIALFFSDRRAPLLFVPAAAGLVPFAVKIATQPPQWGGPGGTVVDALETVLGGSRIAPVILAVLLLATLLWPRLNRSQRVLLAGAAALLIGVLAISPVRGVAEGGALWLLPMSAALFGSLYTAAPVLKRLASTPGGVRIAVGAILVLLMARALWKAPQHAPQFDRWCDSARHFSLEWDAYASPGETVFFDPSYFSGNLYLYMTGAHISKAMRPAECGDNLHCFEHEGTVFAARPLDPANPTPGLWVSFECHDPPPALPACEEVTREPCLTVQRCP